VALDEARTDADGAAALVSFVAAFHDGHFAPTTTPEASGAGPEPPQRAEDTDASAACAAAGYSPATRIAFSLPFEWLSGVRMDSERHDCGRRAALRVGAHSEIPAGGVSDDLCRDVAGVGEDRCSVVERVGGATQVVQCGARRCCDCGYRREWRRE